MQTLHLTVARRTQEEVFSITRKLLKELATVSLEESFCAVFVARLEGLTGKPRQQLVTVLKAASQPVLVRSAFELSDAQHAAIRAALQAFAAKDVPTQFETSPDLIGGVELTVDGQKVAWSLADALDALQAKVGALSSDRDMRQTHAEPIADVAPAGANR